jgi:hypothetical protein
MGAEACVGLTTMLLAAVTINTYHSVRLSGLRICRPPSSDRVHVRTDCWVSSSLQDS